MDYEVLYHLMVDASERAIEAIERQNCCAAKDILIQDTGTRMRVFAPRPDDEEAK